MQLQAQTEVVPKSHEPAGIDGPYDGSLKKSGGLLKNEIVDLHYKGTQPYPQVFCGLLGAAEGRRTPPLQKARFGHEAIFDGS